MHRAYYNHDHIWARRVKVDHPVWGSNSFKVYYAVSDYLKDLGFHGAQVLDIGCGAGILGKVLQAEGHEYTGVDESAVAIELGSRHFPDADLAICDFAFSQIPEEYEGRFEALISINVLHCLVEQTERQNFLRNAYSCAKNASAFILTTMCGPVESTYRQNESPRLYATKADIIAEMQDVGWSRVQELRYIPPFGRSKIPNVHLVGFKD